MKCLHLSFYKINVKQVEMPQHVTKKENIKKILH